MMELSNVPRYLMVERTPCFIWSADGPTMEVNKLLNPSDLLPTLLNLFGIESDYHYLVRMPLMKTMKAMWSSGSGMDQQFRCI